MILPEGTRTDVVWRAGYLVGYEPTTAWTLVVGAVDGERGGPSQRQRGLARREMLR